MRVIVGKKFAVIMRGIIFCFSFARSAYAGLDLGSVFLDLWTNFQYKLITVLLSTSA